jgi:diguanylate cyclase (GGDEF)-like protein/PAS domain S-box-containing protein
MDIAGAFRYSSSVVAVLSVDDGAIVDVNPAFERIVGWSREEVIGRLPVELGVYPDPETRATIWGALRSRAYVSALPIVVATRHGERLYGTISAEIFERDGKRHVLAIVQEPRPVGTPAHAEHDRESYRALFQSAFEGIYRSLPGGGFIDVNPAMARIFGFQSPAQLLAEHGYRPSQAYVDREQSERLYATLERDGAIENTRSLIRRRDGVEVWISENARAVRDANGRTLFYEGTVSDITAHVAAERALRESEAQYRALVDNHVDGVFLFQHGLILFVNRAMAQMLGRRVEDLIGRDYMEVVAPHAQAAQLERRARRESGSADVFEHIVTLLHADGHEILAEVRSAPIEYRGAIASTGTIRDITDERARERQLRDAERNYRELFENSPVGLFKTSVDGRVVECNARLATMMGHASPAAVKALGRNMREIYAEPNERDRVLAELARNGRLENFQTQLLRADGSRLWVEISARAVLEEDGTVGYFDGSVRDVMQERRAEARLRFHATHDSLTGLSNRFAFQQQLHGVMRQSRARQAHDYAVLFLDLDGFKLVNDSLGHSAGDRLLVAIAERLRDMLDDEDAVARYGGDEFTILLCGTRVADAKATADRVLGLFARPFDIGGHRVWSGASVGIVVGSNTYRTVDQVMRDADTAMYRAKAQGKASHVVFDEAMGSAARARFQLETDLRHALERNEFRVYYQPIVSMETGAVVAAEALVRWQHPQRGLLLPHDFLAVAEESGTVAEIDWWVLETACTQVLDWQRRLPTCAELRINVNVDERQVSAPSFADDLGDALLRSGIAARHVWLEITETVFRLGRGRSATLLGSLKALGVGLVVDDFGTGYSSLDLFAASPFDGLKVDRAFVADVETNRRHRAIVRTITRFAEDLGLNLTAEGVESAEQANMVRELGCQQAQGFLYSPPLPAEEFEALVCGHQPIGRRRAS